MLRSGRHRVHVRQVCGSIGL